MNNLAMFGVDKPLYNLIYIGLNLCLNVIALEVIRFHLIIEILTKQFRHKALYKYEKLMVLT